MGSELEQREIKTRSAVMDLKWTAKAVSDLTRLYEFLVPVNRRAAAHAIQALTAAPLRLRDHSRIGERLDEFGAREVRRILVGKYEMRYEIQASTNHILRIWHTREDR